MTATTKAVIQAKAVTNKRHNSNTNLLQLKNPQPPQPVVLLRYNRLLRLMISTTIFPSNH